MLNNSYHNLLALYRALLSHIKNIIKFTRKIGWTANEKSIKRGKRFMYSKLHLFTAFLVIRLSIRLFYNQ